MTMVFQHNLLALFLLAIATVAVVAAVDDMHSSRCPDNWRQIRKRLATSRNKWAKRSPSTDCYNMTLEKQCFCAPDYRGPHQLQIVDGQIQNTTMFATEMPTVEEIFDLVYDHCVKDCPASGAASCRVRFDGEYGYVKSVWIDVSAQIADEEVGYVVSDLSFCDA